MIDAVFPFVMYLVGVATGAVISALFSYYLGGG